MSKNERGKVLFPRFFKGLILSFFLSLLYSVWEAKETGHGAAKHMCVPPPPACGTGLILRRSAESALPAHELAFRVDIDVTNKAAHQSADFL